MYIQKLCTKHTLHRRVFQCWVLNSRVGTFNCLGKQEKPQWKRNEFEICNGNESSLPYFQSIKEFKCIWSIKKKTIINSNCLNIFQIISQSILCYTVSGEKVYTLTVFPRGENFISLGLLVGKWKTGKVK